MEAEKSIKKEADALVAIQNILLKLQDAIETLKKNNELLLA